VGVVALDALPRLAAQTGGPLGGLQFQIEGEGGGCIIVLFPLAAIQHMLDAILAHAPEGSGFSEVERSAICEIGNVLASSFLTELGDGTGRRLMPSTPRLLLDDVEQVMAETRAALERRGREVVVIRGLFEDPEHEIEGRFLDRAWTTRQK
jgi:chemotaxis protein CheC